jgi:uncharacterized membrane protein YcaP (DUF421 family)
MFTDVFSFTMDPLEVVLRGTAMYWFLFAMFRFVLRRDVGAVGIADVLLLVIVADAAQNGMSGDYKTVPEGMLLVGTLIGWNVLLDWASFRFTWIRRLAEPPPLLLLRNGRFHRRNMRRELITTEELMAALRQHGVKEPSEVSEAYMEGDGSFSVLTKDKRPAGGGHKGPPGG